MHARPTIRFRPAVLTSVFLSVWTFTLVMSGAAVRGEKRLVGSIAARPLPRPARTPSAIEQRVRPWFEARAGIAPPSRDIAARRPTQQELFAIAQSWDRLSDSFKALYTAAVQAPSGMLVHESPGGHFDILYTTSGIDRVDPTDTYGYASGNWRQRQLGPNGVPDYVDEVAWACDSAWSMEVERFEFPEPHPDITPAYPSDRYKVSILNLDSMVVNGDTIQTGYSLYGQTFPVEQAQGSIGFVSRFELRCNWNGAEWRDVADNNYEAEPEKAAHITCVHEFLHAIQYAMTHTLRSAVELDHFPEGWIEATAVLMEELAFDTVNDYLQYCTGYFRTPQSPVLVGWGYGGSVVAIYLYERGPGSEGIDFIRRVFLDNYSSPAPFHTLLDGAAVAYGTRWSTLLSGFHSESYFTGARADGRYFTKDAALLPTWSYRQDPADKPVTETSAIIQAFGMEAFSRRRYEADNDTLVVQVAGRRVSGGIPYDDQWGARVLLRPNGAAHFDTAIAMRFDATATDTVRITPWRSYDEALVVVSNAHKELSGEVVVAFDSLIGELPVAEGMPLTLFPNPVRLHTTRELSIVGPRLTRATIYTLDGHLLFQFAPRRDTSRISWHIDRHELQPGTYIAAIERYDSAAKAIVHERKKFLLVP